ncbi:MAG: J domain-containing protein [Minwuia sp.]|nr:J domain-containing protein [Minwuia sp.]
MARTQQKRRTNYGGRIHTGEANARPCEKAGCLELGEFRAPKSRDGADGYHLFCLDHVREYNKSYNYFADMPEEEAASFQHSAAYGHRETWPMGHRTATMRARASFTDPFGFADERAERKAAKEAEKRRQSRQYTAEQRDAFRTLDIDPTDDLHALKRHYKQLVKRFHPDANGGDRRAEDRLKNINQAFSVLNAGLS